MSVVKIVTYPDPILREKIPDVGPLDDLEDCLEEAFDTLEAEPRGAALAANQIGVRKRFFVIHEDIARAHDVPRLIINPKVERAGKILATEEEGCLSFPDQKVMVTRPKKIDVSFSPWPMMRKTITLTGFISRLFQHEIAHLDGILFIDELPGKLGDG